jgi:hypothetical protein
MALSGWEWFFIIFIGITGIFLIVYGIIVWRRKSKWYVFNIQGDFNNPRSQPWTGMLAERFDKGVMTGAVYKSVLSLWPLFIINSIPDLAAYRHGMQLYAWRGASGEQGDINYTFVLQPLISKPSAQKLISKMHNDMDATYKEALAKLTPEQKAELINDQTKFDEFLIKLFDVQWVERNVGIVTTKREDILLREERVVHAAINSDNAGFAEAHKDAWQKLQQIINAMALPIILIAIGLGAYFAYSGFQIAQQTTFGYDQYLATQLNQQISQTNALNSWLYQELAAINVYGVKAPQNLSTVKPITTGTVLPSTPTT